MTYILKHRGLISCVLGKGQTKLLHPEVILLTKNTLKARSIYPPLTLRQWVPELLCFYEPETSVCWGTCQARMVPDHRLDAILE